ncbi:MAG TPA: hypothetical protein VME43_18870 [Bryobacteraceae bacterium]|nr:hypothetical protein [Bryobacteraceae bacterium]
MSKAIETLSKNLASGMSRRKALWHFVSGLGAVGAVASLGAKKAKASQAVSLACQIFCNTQAQEILTICHQVNGNNVVREVICNGIVAEFQAACLAASARCRSGFCAEFVGVSDDSTITTASYTDYIDGEGDFTCVPAEGGFFG